jgi:hypothetical protein
MIFDLFLSHTHVGRQVDTEKRKTKIKVEVGTLESYLVGRRENFLGPHQR